MLSSTTRLTLEDALTILVAIMPTVPVSMITTIMAVEMTIAVVVSGMLGRQL